MVGDIVVLLLLITFILVRAVSLHAVDQMVFTRIAGVTVSSIVEAAGIVVMLADSDASSTLTHAIQKTAEGGLSAL
jgi:hypothetical protein